MLKGNLTTTGPFIWFKRDSNSIIIDSDEFAVNYIKSEIFEYKSTVMRLKYNVEMTISGGMKRNFE